MSFPIDKEKLDRKWNPLGKSDDECWPFQGCVRPNKGYGTISKLVDGKVITLYAHKESWKAYNGPIPLNANGKSLFILHECDNKWCVNPYPKHTNPGTASKNNMDKVYRKKPWYRTGRITQFTPQDILVMRDLVAKRLTHKEISKIFNCCSSTISKTLSGKLGKTAKLRKASNELSNKRTS